MAARLISVLACSQAVLGAAIISRQTTSKCATGVHIIAARGTGEAPGEGAIGSLASDIVARIPGSDSVALAYPASVLPSYEMSEGSGTKNMTMYIQQYVASCPNTKIVLLGYSQGAEVAMDTICGTTSSGFAATAPLASQYGSHISAIVAYGDPSHIKGEPYDFGTSVKNGDFPRNPAGCVPYSSRIASYCDTGDPFCDSGDDLEVHLMYDQKYDTNATNFVVAHST